MATPRVLVTVLRHLFELVLGPRGDSVDVTFVVAHEVQLADRDGNRLGADPEKTADIDDGGGGWAGAVDVRNRADLVVFSIIDARTLENGGRKFG